MWGRATFAMEVSSTSINVARVTVSAINQGLCLGCQPSTEEWCTGLAAGFRCGCTVAVTNACPGTHWNCFLDCTKLQGIGIGHRSSRGEWVFHTRSVHGTPGQIAGIPGLKSETWGTLRSVKSSLVDLLFGLIPVTRNQVV